MIKKSQRIQKSVIFLIGMSILTGTILGSVIGRPQEKSEASFAPKRTMNAKELAWYNGTRSEQPIYLALDGFVYDVTNGRAYYQAGGAYHYLAGTDASRELHIAGGAIIKQKYPIIAIYSP